MLFRSVVIGNIDSGAELPLLLQSCFSFAFTDKGEPYKKGVTAALAKAQNWAASCVQNFADDCIGEKVEKLANELKPGGVLLLENVRYYNEEEANDSSFAEKLAKLADVYVNDAFGAAHRAHASTVGITKFIKVSAAGALLKKEIEYLEGAVENPVQIGRAHV